VLQLQPLFRLLDGGGHFRYRHERSRDLIQELIRILFLSQ
jgi:hypothetical protein